MPRRARRESATGFYHIVSRGLDRENIFGEKREKTRFLNLLKDNLKDCNIVILRSMHIVLCQIIFTF